MNRSLFLFLFGLAIITALILPRIFNWPDSIQIPVTGSTIFLFIPLLYVWRMIYLGWTKQEIIHHFTPFKLNKKYWELFFGDDRL
ncbi:hypothetical protein [Neolewinella persica]|uniref:hypothetical protein n=1 Tax=Neolewinella persica TaxID=70998 RepID=UPI0003732D4F|nr:hypothetical protein [Neolewinella persica]